MIDNNFILPVTEMRGQLGAWIDKVKGDNYVVLTKSGRPKAALVDVKYLNQLESEVNRLYQKTFINPKTLPYTRDFSDAEIDAWLETDKI